VTPKPANATIDLPGVSTARSVQLASNRLTPKYLDLHKRVQKHSISTPQQYPVSDNPNLGRIVTRSGRGPKGDYKNHERKKSILQIKETITKRYSK